LNDSAPGEAVRCATSSRELPAADQLVDELQGRPCALAQVGRTSHRGDEVEQQPLLGRPQREFVGEAPERRFERGDLVLRVFACERLRRRSVVAARMGDGIPQHPRQRAGDPVGDRRA
jgi:hypothetical protein